MKKTYFLRYNDWFLQSNNRWALWPMNVQLFSLSDARDRRDRIAANFSYPVEILELSI